MVPSGSLFDPRPPKIESSFKRRSKAVLVEGDCFEALKGVPRDAMKLVITSPPYNLGKEYEMAAELDAYLEALNPIVNELVRVLHPEGSICWQVGNYVKDGEVYPLDIL